MMKKYFAILIVVMMTIQVIKAEGIRFENISLPEALAKAKAENKLVFIDCYIPSCGPCKFMADNVFPLDECGDYFNPRFISLKKNLEEEENRNIATDYHVCIYPTFLILNPDGSIYYKQDGGATRTADKFLQKMKTMMRVGSCKARYDKGERNAAFMTDYIVSLKGFNNLQLRELMDRYVPALSVDSLASPALWDVVTDNIIVTESPAFEYLLKNRKALARNVGSDVLAEKLTAILMRDYQQGRSMLRNFGTRIANVELLESEGYILPTLLPQMMKIRQVINNRIDNMDDIVAAIEAIASSKASEDLKVAALNEVAGIKSFATAASCRRVYDALNYAATALSSSALESLGSTLRLLQ